MQFEAVSVKSCHSAPEEIGHKAISALYAEAMLTPKPGLVSPADSGSHPDMDISTFLASIHSLRFYFRDVVIAGVDGAPFSELQTLGIAAEKEMLRATSGINTHRGAIFSLGLIAAAAGYLARRSLSPSGARLGSVISSLWGEPIFIAGLRAPVNTHGSQVIKVFGASGARPQAIEGFPILRETILPVLDNVLAEGCTAEQAQIQALFTAMSTLDDTNILYRGGIAGLKYVRKAARGFLEAGGVFQKNWPDQVNRLHRSFVSRNLSPGGSADMLAAAWFIHLLTREEN